MTKSSFAILAAAILLAPSLASAQFVDSKGNKTGKARHDIAKRCAVSAGIPIHADGSWNEGSPEALAKYRACKAKNNISGKWTRGRLSWRPLSFKRATVSPFGT